MTDGGSGTAARNDRRGDGLAARNDKRRDNATAAQRQKTRSVIARSEATWQSVPLAFPLWGKDGWGLALGPAYGSFG